MPEVVFASTLAGGGPHAPAHGPHATDADRERSPTSTLELRLDNQRKGQPAEATEPEQPACLREGTAALRGLAMGSVGRWRDWVPGARAIHPICSFPIQTTRLMSSSLVAGVGPRARERVDNILAGLRAVEDATGLSKARGDRARQGSGFF